MYVKVTLDIRVGRELLEERLRLDRYSSRVQYRWLRIRITVLELDFLKWIRSIHGRFC